MKIFQIRMVEDREIVNLSEEFSTDFFFEFFPFIYNFQDLFVSECDSRLSVDWLSLPLLDPGSKEVSSRIQFIYAGDLFSAPVTFPLFF